MSIILLLSIITRVYSSPREGGTLRVATTSDPKTFNIILANETSSTAVLGLLFEGLVEIDGVTTLPKPALAVSWSVSEDGQEWIFNLRKGVRWFDGKEFTADDVVFTFKDLIYNKEIPCSARNIFTVDGKEFEVIKLSRYKVRFVTPTPYAPLLRELAHPILPKHRLEKYVREGLFNQVWGIDTPVEEIIGTGPFKLKEYVPGQRIVFEKNPLYWKKDKEGRTLPYIKKIIMYIVGNTDVQIMRFISGRIDVVSVRGTDYGFLLKYKKSKGFEIYDCGPAFGTQFLAFNLSKVYCNPMKYKWFSNKKFRKAIAYAIDRESIINNVYYGLAVPQYGPLNRSCGGFYYPYLRKYWYNPQKAKFLLRKAGFVDRDEDGIREDIDGNKVSFVLFTNADNSLRVDIASIIQTDLQKIGLDVIYRPLDFNTLVNKLTNSHDWDVVLLGLTGSVEPHSGKNVWAIDGFLHFWNPVLHREDLNEEYKKGIFWWEKEIDSIFNVGVRIMDEKKRYKVYWKWQKIVAEEVPLIYIVAGKVIYAVNKRIKNVHPTSYGGVFHNIEEIWIEDE